MTTAMSSCSVPDRRRAAGVYGEGAYVGPVLHLVSAELQLLLELLGFIPTALSARRAQAGNHEKSILV